MKLTKNSEFCQKPYPILGPFDKTDTFDTTGPPRTPRVDRTDRTDQNPYPIPEGNVKIDSFFMKYSQKSVISEMSGLSVTFLGKVLILGNFSKFINNLSNLPFS